MNIVKFLLPIAFFSLPLFSEEEEEVSYSLWDYHPLHGGVQTIQTAKANIDDTSYGGNLYFGKNNAYLQMLVPISRTSYFFPRVEWNQFTMAGAHFFPHETSLLEDVFSKKSANFDSNGIVLSRQWEK